MPDYDRLIAVMEKSRIEVPDPERPGERYAIIPLDTKAALQLCDLAATVAEVFERDAAYRVQSYWWQRLQDAEYGFSDAFMEVFGDVKFSSVQSQLRMAGYSLRMVPDEERTEYHELVMRALDNYGTANAEVVSGPPPLSEIGGALVQ